MSKDKDALMNALDTIGAYLEALDAHMAKDRNEARREEMGQMGATLATVMVCGTEEQILETAGVIEEQYALFQRNGGQSEQ